MYTIEIERPDPTGMKNLPSTDKGKSSRGTAIDRRKIIELEKLQQEAKKKTVDDELASARLDL